MSTPYDGKIAVLYWQGSSVGEITIDQIIQTLKQYAPNVGAIWIKTNDGPHWQGAGPAGAKPDLDINGVDDIARWIAKAGAAGLDVHAWCVLNGTQPDQEADIVAQVCGVNGLKSMVLDIEVGTQYFTGGPQAVAGFAQSLRAKIQSGFHLGLCLDARGNHPRDIHIDQWLPFVDSLHPMAYHKDFGQTPDETLNIVYAALAGYQKPIIPMLQGYGLAPNDHGDLLVAGNLAFGKYQSPGISIFRFGSLGLADFPFVAQISIPDASPRTHTFDFTGQQLKDAFGTVAAYLHQDIQQMLISAGLTNLDQQLSTKYVGLAVQDLPGLTEIQKI